MGRKKMKKKNNNHWTFHGKSYFTEYCKFVPICANTITFWLVVGLSVIRQYVKIKNKDQKLTYNLFAHSTSCGMFIFYKRNIWKKSWF